MLFWVPRSMISPQPKRYRKNTSWHTSTIARRLDGIPKFQDYNAIWGLPHFLWMNTLKQFVCCQRLSRRRRRMLMRVQPWVLLILQAKATERRCRQSLPSLTARPRILNLDLPGPNPLPKHEIRRQQRKRLRVLRNLGELQVLQAVFRMGNSGGN